MGMQSDGDCLKFYVLLELRSKSYFYFLKFLVFWVNWSPWKSKTCIYFSVSARPEGEFYK